MRKAAIAALALAAVIAAAVLALPLLFDAGALMRPIEDHAAKAGLAIETDGEPRLRMLWTPALEIDGPRIVDRDGDTVAEAQTIVAGLNLFDLLGGNPGFGAVRVVDGRLPLDAASLSLLAELAPAGASSVTLEGGRFEAGDGLSIDVRELRLARAEGGGATVRGAVGTDGALAVEGELDAADSDGLRPASLTLAPEDGDPVTLEALVGRTDDGWLIDDGKITLPGLTLTGDGLLYDDERWLVSLGLRAEGGTLDQLPAGDIAAAVDTLSRIARLELVIRMDEAAWRGGVVRDLQMDMSADRGEAQIVALVATLPGLSTVSLSGTAAPISGPDATLAGTGLADTGAPVELLEWLGMASPWAEGAAPRHAVLDSAYRIGADGFALENLTARLGPTTLTGDLAWSGGPAGIEASLKANALDLGELASPAWLLRVGLRPFDAEIDLAVLRSGGRTLGPATLRASGDGERIALESFALPDAGGLSLSLDGSIEAVRETPALDLSMRASGATEDVWRALGIGAPRWLLEKEGATLEGTLRGPLSDVAVAADGRYGTLPVRVGGRLGIGLDGPDYALDVHAERADGPPVDLPLTVEGNARALAVTIADGGLIGRIPLAGRIETGFEDGATPLRFRLRSQVAPVFAALGTNAKAEGGIEARFDGTVAPVDETGPTGVLDGGGSMTLGEGSIEGFDLARLDRAIAEADGPTGLINLVAQLGGSGTTRLNSAEIPYTVNRGKLEIRDAAIDAEGADLTSAGVVEMATGRVDLHMRMSLDSTPEAPPIALDVRGQWNKLRARLDFNKLQRFLLDGKR